MRTVTAFLADKASLDAQGLLSVEGGLWSALKATRFPAEHPFHVVALLDVLDAEVGVPVTGSLAFSKGDGQPAGTLDVEIRASKAGDRVPVVMPVLGTFSAAGRYELLFTLGGQEQARLAFEVTGTVPDIFGGPVRL